MNKPLLVGKQNTMAPKRQIKEQPKPLVLLTTQESNGPKGRKMSLLSILRKKIKNKLDVIQLIRFFVTLFFQQLTLLPKV